MAELLDALPSEAPEAQRSRRDLRLINGLMGNERWILGVLRGLKGDVVELGAGDGCLTRKMMPGRQVTGLDFQEKPEELDCHWVSGDLFESLAEVKAPVVVANLILHHFEEERLARLGELFRERQALVFVEPWRSRLALVEGGLLFPFVNRVTRHDMMVSIRAGFVRGELQRFLGLGEEWAWREEVSLLGGLRVVAYRS